VAAGVFGFDAAYPLSELAAKLPELLKGSSCVYASRAQGLAAETDVAAGLQGARLRQKGIEWRESSYLLGELRLVKSEWEIAQLREACRLGSRMHEIAMRRGRPGRHEYELQAWMEGFARENGSLWMGYASIVASGENATCLHYGVNNCRIEEGEVVLVDAGCEWNGFTSDITRTFPASGRFSKEQRALYEVVLRAQKEAIARVRPGATLKELSEHATAVLVEGLLSLGLLAGDARALVEGKEHKAFYPHSLSHWLGMDVHDVGAYEAAGSDRPLEPGMCFTIEPGLYIQPDNEAVAAVWRGLGIRIEDDILVTADGSENLVDCPKEVEEVEALCR
jgi:Xaa-Pro aminopeptidase